MIRKNGGEEHRKPCFPLNSVPSQLRKHFFEESHALSNVNFMFSLEETIKVLQAFIHYCQSNAQCTVCVSAYEQQIAAVLFHYRGLYRYRSRRKQRVSGLLPVPRGSQVPCLFLSGTLQNLYV